MNARDAILSRIIDAKEDRTYQSYKAYTSYSLPPIERFKERLAALGARTMSLDEARDRCPRPAYVDQDIAGLWGEPSTCDDIWQAAAGVTGTVCAVAHSGTLLVTAGTGRKRMASLAPPVHIALVDKIVLTLDQAMRLVPQQTSVLVTGPSRTADIEGVLVNGVHGPGQLCVVILEDCVVEDTASGG